MPVEIIKPMFWKPNQRLAKTRTCGKFPSTTLFIRPLLMERCEAGGSDKFRSGKTTIEHGQR